METTISGGISGAITDPDSPKAIKLSTGTRQTTDST